MSTDLHTLSGAYAIDALSVTEAQEFASHLEQCQACRDEVRELQSVAALMGESESLRAPAALKARIMAAADLQSQLPPKVTPIGAARSHRWSSRIAGAAAAVVLIVAAGFGISQVQQNHEAVMAQSVARVFDAKDAHTETVDTSNGGKITVATSKQLGQLAVETHALPRLSNEQVYQLWTVHGGSATSAGLVQNLAGGKSMGIPAQDSTMAITIEPAGGSAHPTTKPIVRLDPTTV